MIPRVLSIAGVDPSGGAGLLADLKAFSALGAYGMGVVTALTAQNTRGVSGVQLVPPDFVAQQIDAVFADVTVDAVKVGMLGSAELVAIVADRLAAHRVKRIVVDPVMVAKSGHRLLTPDAVAALRDRLLPLAELITPNLPEAADLLDEPAPTSVPGMRDMAKRLVALGSRNVLLKGGHLTGRKSVDILQEGDAATKLSARRIDTRNTHGTGCTLSAAITALLPQRADLASATSEAKDYLTHALASADRLRVGSGHGPVHHFHALWSAAAR
jgi:hydroxymethylpyrimidine/phosphomethylpyrimidine kinase